MSISLGRCARHTGQCLAGDLEEGRHMDIPGSCAVQPDTSAAAGEGTATTGAEEMLRRRDGTSFPVEYSASPLADGAAVRGAVVVFRDITTQRRARDDLELQVATLAQQADLLNLTHVSIIVRT